MSSGHLVAELQALRQELSALSSRVLVLEEQSADLRGSSSTPILASPPVTVNYLGGGGLPELPPFPFSGDRGYSSPAGETVGSVVRSEGGGVRYTEAERLRVAQSIGAFLQRSLSGQSRGESGRSRIRLPSTHYILCRDLAGRLYDPVRIFTNFSILRPLVKEGNCCGDSVFIGVPSEWEARAAVRAANLSWPPADGRN